MSSSFSQGGGQVTSDIFRRGFALRLTDSVLRTEEHSAATAAEVTEVA